MRLLARYGSVEELATDVRDQLPRGGMVVRTPVPTGLQLFSPVEVAVECGGKAIVVAGQVLQIFPGVGVAVGFDRPARDRIEGMATGTRSDQPRVSLPVPDPAAAPVDREAASAAAVKRTESDLDVIELAARLARGTAEPAAPPMATLDPSEPRRPAVATGSSPAIARTGTEASGSAAERIQLALRGDRDQRLAIMRDKNRTLHVYVLRNPGLTVDEVAVIARMPTVAPDVLVQIAERREWGHRPEVAMSLVRNPATPMQMAVKLVEFVAVSDLRALAKDARTREPVQRAARKRLLS